MKSILVKSVMLRAELFQPLEIEIQLVPGLPTIQFLGLPSAGLRESAMRIRTAIRSASFKMPRGSQILVDIRPREEKKHGRGVDLAVAVGYLILSGQLDASIFEDAWFYGDLGLSGDVMAPSDWERVRVLHAGKLVTGRGPVEGQFREGRGGEGLQVVEHLESLSAEGLTFPNAVKNLNPRREAIEIEDDVLEANILLEESQAELALVTAVGGHSLLLAGAPGSGKSTLARIIHRMRPALTVEEACEIETWSGENRRPLVEPHHTASGLAMVGGSHPPKPGAITRAHLGTLLMDEVLMFRPEVQEALREPLETGFVHLARGPESRKFPAEFQLIGTTNLCDCGRWTPISEEACKCRSSQRDRFDRKLKGPFVDRFQLLTYTNAWRPAQGSISTDDLRLRVEKIREFQISEGRPNGNRRWKPIGADTLFARLEKAGSERRRLSVQRVARTFADLDLRREINEYDVFKARGLALDTFDLLHSDTKNSKAWVLGR